MTTTAQSIEKRKKVIASLQKDLRDREEEISAPSTEKSIVSMFFSSSFSRSRLVYLLYTLPILILCFVGADLFLIPQARLFLAALFCVFLWSLIAQSKGRLLDIGQEKKWSYFWLVPIVNIVFYLYLLMTPSKK